MIVLVCRQRKNTAPTGSAGRPEVGTEPGKDISFVLQNKSFEQGTILLGITVSDSKDI